MCAAHAGRHGPIVRDKRFFRFAPSQRLETFVDTLLLLWIQEVPRPDLSVESPERKHPLSQGRPTTDPQCCWGPLPGKKRNLASRHEHCAHPVLPELRAQPPRERSACISDRSEYLLRLE